MDLVIHTEIFPESTTPRKRADPVTPSACTGTEPEDARAIGKIDAWRFTYRPS